MEEEAIEWITAACRAASTALPRGERGVEAALLWLQAFPAACRLGFGDVTASAPGLFRLYVGVGLIPSCPSDGAMTGAIRLIASVSQLVVKRSPRTWTAWMGSACDPASPIATALRSAVTPAMLRVPKVPAATKRRVGSIRSERDRLAGDLVAVRDELEQTRRRADELCAERDRLAADLSAAGERQRASDQDQTRSAATLAEVRGALTTSRRELEQTERRRLEAVENARNQEGQVKALTAARDHLRVELSRQTKQAVDLNSGLKALERELDEQTARRRDLEDKLPLVTAERDQRFASLKAAEQSLGDARAELESLRGSLVREATAHAETRKLLQNTEARRIAAIHEHGRLTLQEKERLDAATASADAATRALATICRWLDLDPDRFPDLDRRLEAILSAVDLCQTTHRRFVHRVEEKLTRLYSKMISGLFEAHLYREAYPDTSFESKLERARPEILEQAEARAKKAMAKLSELGPAELRDE